MPRLTNFSLPHGFPSDRSPDIPVEESHSLKTLSKGQQEHHRLASAAPGRQEAGLSENKPTLQRLWNKVNGHDAELEKGLVEVRRMQKHAMDMQLAMHSAMQKESPKGPQDYALRATGAGAKQEARLSEKMPTLKRLEHKTKGLFTFETTDKLPSLRLGEWDIEAAKDIVALRHVEQSEYLNPSKVDKIELARSIYELRKHQQEKGKGGLFSKNWECDEALEALLNAFHYPKDIDQLKRGMTHGGTGYEHRARAFLAHYLNDGTGVVGSGLTFASAVSHSAADYAALGTINALRTLLSSAALGFGMTIGLERLKRKGRETLAAELAPKTFDSMENAPTLSQAVKLSRELERTGEKLRRQKKSDTKDFTPEQTELYEQIQYEIATTIAELQHEIKAHQHNTGVEWQGSKRQLPARLTAIVLKLGSLGALGAKGIGVVLIPLAFTVASVIPHLFYQYSDGAGKDAKDKGTAAILTMLKSDDWINTKHITRDEIADLYEKYGEGKILKADLEKALTQAFNMDVVTGKMVDLPVGARFCIAEKLLQAKCAEAIGKVVRTHEREHNPGMKDRLRQGLSTTKKAVKKNIAQIRHREVEVEPAKLQRKKEKAESLIKDALLFQEVLSVLKQADAIDSTYLAKIESSPSLQEKEQLRKKTAEEIQTILDHASEKLAAIQDKDVHMLFGGSLLEQSLVDHKARSLTGERFKYGVSYAAGAAFTEINVFNFTTILNGVQASENIHLAKHAGGATEATQPVPGPHFRRFGIGSAISSLTTGGGPPVSGHRPNLKKVSGKTRDELLLEPEHLKKAANDYTIDLSTSESEEETSLKTVFDSIIRNGATPKSLTVKNGNSSVTLAFEKTQPFFDEHWRKMSWFQKPSFFQKTKSSERRISGQKMQLMKTNLFGTFFPLVGISLRSSWHIVTRDPIKRALNKTRTERRESDHAIGELRKKIQDRWFELLAVTLDRPEFIAAAKKANFGMKDFLQLVDMPTEGKDKTARYSSVPGDMASADEVQDWIDRKAGNDDHFVFATDDRQFATAKRAGVGKPWQVVTSDGSNVPLKDFMANNSPVKITELGFMFSWSLVKNGQKNRIEENLKKDFWQLEFSKNEAEENNSDDVSEWEVFVQILDRAGDFEELIKAAAEIKKPAKKPFADSLSYGGSKFPTDMEKEDKHITSAPPPKVSSTNTESSVGSGTEKSSSIRLNSVLRRLSPTSKSTSEKASGEKSIATSTPATSAPSPYQIVETQTGLYCLPIAIMNLYQDRKAVDFNIVTRPNEGGAFEDLRGVKIRKQDGTEEEMNILRFDADQLDSIEPLLKRSSEGMILYTGDINVSYDRATNRTVDSDGENVTMKHFVALKPATTSEGHQTWWELDGNNPKSPTEIKDVMAYLKKMNGGGLYCAVPPDVSSPIQQAYEMMALTPRFPDAVRAVASALEINQPIGELLDFLKDIGQQDAADPEWMKSWKAAQPAGWLAQKNSPPPNPAWLAAKAASQNIDANLLRDFINIYRENREAPSAQTYTFANVKADHVAEQRADAMLNWLDHIVDSGGQLQDRVILRMGTEPFIIAARKKDNEWRVDLSDEKIREMGIQGNSESTESQEAPLLKDFITRQQKKLSALEEEARTDQAIEELRREGRIFEAVTWE